MEIKIFSGFLGILYEVLLALIPLVLFFLFFQAVFLKLPWRRVINILKGVLLAFAGLSLFLQGVHVGFLPTGEMMGKALGSLPYNWVLVPIGFVLGFVATFAEPAVRVMNYEVEKTSGGYISAKIMLYTLSLGVALSIALSIPVPDFERAIPVAFYYPRIPVGPFSHDFLQPHLFRYCL